MRIRSYLSISGSIFALVAVAHLVRLLAGWQVTIDGWEAPGWISVIGLLVPAALATWAFRLASTRAAPPR